jgi:hypothetical protein
MTGYWVAAACLLLVLIPAVRFLHHPPVPAMLHSSVRQQSLAEKVDPSLRQVRSASSDLHQPPANPPQVSAESNNILLSHTPVSSPPSRLLKNNPARHLRPAALPLAVAEVSTQAAPAPDSPRLIALASVPKKPLKVVYLNELNTGGAPSPATASRYHFSLRIGPETGGSSDLPETTGPSILKINLSAQNH